MKKTALYLLAALLVVCALPVSAETPRSMLPENARFAMYTTAESYDDVYAISSGNMNENSVDLDNASLVEVQSLTEALMLLTSGRVDAFAMFSDCTRYLASRNDGMIAFNGLPDVTLHMIAKEDHAALIGQIDEALAAMAGDGTLDALRQTHVEDVIAGADPVAVALPVIDGAPTYRVGVSGDLPPLDYTTADGVPAGYNTALLAALSDRLGVNFEPVTMEGGARFLSLETGTIDLFFWHNTTDYGLGLTDEAAIEAVGTIVVQSVEGYTISAPYSTMKIGWLMMAE